MITLQGVRISVVGRSLDIERDWNETMAPRENGVALTGDATTLGAAPPGADPPLALLSGPPKPTTEGVPTGFRRWLQLHWREILSPRNLLFAGAPLLLLGLGLGWRHRRRRLRA